jgi:hypothetical protein
LQRIEGHLCEAAGSLENVDQVRAPPFLGIRAEVDLGACFPKERVSPPELITVIDQCTPGPTSAERRS